MATVVTIKSLRAHGHGAGSKMWTGHEVIINITASFITGILSSLGRNSHVPESERTRGLGADPVWLQKKPDGRGPRADVILQ